MSLFRRNRTFGPAVVAIAALCVGATAGLAATRAEIDRAISAALAARKGGDLDRAVALLRPVADPADGDPRPDLLLAETLAWQKAFGESEQLYRRILRRFPENGDALLGLGRVLLWEGRYRESREMFREILETDPRRVDAREELARSWYWSGDYRRAESEFRQVLAADPGRVASAEALEEIRGTARPEARLETSHRSDDQPFQLETIRAIVNLHSDPLSRWGLALGTSELKAENGRRASVPTGRVTSRIGIPEYRATLVGEIGLADLPAGSAELVGKFGVTRRIGDSQQLSLSAEREPLLYNLAALDRVELATRSMLAWEREGRWLAAVRAAHLDYTDRNEGVALDGFMLVPVATTESWSLHAGLSGAWRDTGQSRFRRESIRATPVAPGIFSYEISGIYDPYWTPVDLKEARAIVSGRGAAGPAVRWSVHLTGGVARDRAVAFAAPHGPGAIPDPASVSRFSFDREYHPWTAAAGLEWKLGGMTSLALGYEVSRTVDYEANEIRAAVVGRF